MDAVIAIKMFEECSVSDQSFSSLDILSRPHLSTGMQYNDTYIQNKNVIDRYWVR